MSDWKINFDLPLGGGFSTKFPFIPSDSEEVFKMNLDKFPDSPHLLTYKKYPIEYSVNNYGFRTPDYFFNGDTGTVYLGCSHTFGTGHHLHDIWSTKLHNKFGEGKFFNLSCGSIGLTSQYSFLKYFSEKLNIKNVFHYYPDECFYRYEFLDGGGNTDIFNVNNTDTAASPFFKKYLTHPPHNSLHNLSYLDAIKNVCKEIGCDYYLYTKTYMSEDKIVDAYSEDKRPARDLMHLYVEEHDDIVYNFSKMYIKQNG